MLLLTACCATHTAHMLARVLLAARPRVGLLMRGLAVFLGLGYASLSMLVYTAAGAHRLTTLLGGVGFIVLGHAALLITTLLHGRTRWHRHTATSGRPPAARQGCPDHHGTAARPSDVRVFCTYLSIAAVAAVGLVAQRLESPCPAWLLRTPHVYPHALWHVAIFHALYSSATLLLYLEARLDADVALSSPCARAPWLLLRVVANPTGSGTAEGTRRAEQLVCPESQRTSPGPRVAVACCSSEVECAT